VLRKVLMERRNRAKGCSPLVLAPDFKEFLLYAHGCSYFVQPRTICVTERVKPDPAKSQFQTCRNHVVVAHRIGATRRTGHRAREKPSLLRVEQIDCHFLSSRMKPLSIGTSSSEYSVFNLLSRFPPADR
jgi:hypothetical protein